MKPIAKLILILSLSCSNHSFAQDISAQLLDTCWSDIDLSEYVSQAISAEKPITSDLYNQKEQAQIIAILESKAVVDLSSNEQFAAVISACAEGRILQDRNSHIINQ